MKEIKLIIEAYEDLKQKGIKSALATVVHVEGSSYRRPGARMLISEDGRLTGAISGGCLEGDALKKALLVINDQFSKVVTYDTMDEDDAILGIGLGCNGIIKVLIEPIDNNCSNNPIELFKQIFSDRKHCVITTMFSINGIKDVDFGTKYLTGSDGNFYTNLKNENIKDDIVHYANIALINRQNLWQPISINNEEYVLFNEYLSPQNRLVIIGAGNDVLPLVEMAHIIGWETIIIDGRANYATKNRFANSCSVIVAKPDDILNQINVDNNTFFTLMTHNYNYDKAILHHLALQSNVVYIGMLGPKKKIERILREYQEEGRSLSAQNISKIYSPIGLNIGADTSEEIALSILSEIQAIIRNKIGTPLKEINGQIH